MAFIKRALCGLIPCSYLLSAVAHKNKMLAGLKRQLSLNEIMLVSAYETIGL